MKTSRTFLLLATLLFSFSRVSADVRIELQATAPDPVPVVQSDSSSSRSGGSHQMATLVGTPTLVVSSTMLDVFFQTTYPAVVTFQWGKTPQYELGVLSESLAVSNHHLSLRNLDQKTLYYYRVDLVRNGINTLLYQGNFTTRDGSIPVFFQENVSNLTLVEEGTSMRLSWDNPNNSDFAEVIVVKSPFDYPKTPRDGKIVYEGGGEGVNDVLTDERMYYGVFAKNTKGVASSGALLVAQIESQVTPPPTPFTLGLENILLLQNDISVELRGESFLLPSRDSIRIFIPYYRELEGVEWVVYEETDTHVSYVLSKTEDGGFSTIINPKPAHTTRSLWSLFVSGRSSVANIQGEYPEKNTSTSRVLQKTEDGGFTATINQKPGQTIQPFLLRFFAFDDVEVGTIKGELVFPVLGGSMSGALYIIIALSLLVLLLLLLIGRKYIMSLTRKKEV